MVNHWVNLTLELAIIHIQSNYASISANIYPSVQTTHIYYIQLTSVLSFNILLTSCFVKHLTSSGNIVIKLSLFITLKCNY